MSSYAEAIRRLRAVLDQGMRGKPKDECKVIMITSAISTEGKSSTALALARTYALSGKNVLLIDADLRKPAQHKLINHEPKQGFLDYLASPSEIMDHSDPSFYVVDPKTRTGVILGRGRANIPTDQLLQSDAFAALIENARESMDVVIIDTPPVVPVVDAAISCRSWIAWCSWCATGSHARGMRERPLPSCGKHPLMRPRSLRLSTSTRHARRTTGITITRASRG